MKYGTLTDNQLHPAPRAIRVGGAARLDALKAWLVEQRDRAVLSTTKAIYQAIIDRLEAD